MRAPPKGSDESAVEERCSKSATPVTTADVGAPFIKGAPQRNGGPSHSSDETQPEVATSVDGGRGPVWTPARRKRRRPKRLPKPRRSKKASPGPLFSQWPPPAYALPDLETLRALSMPEGQEGEHDE